MGWGGGFCPRVGQETLMSSSDDENNVDVADTHTGDIPGGDGRHGGQLQLAEMKCPPHFEIGPEVRSIVSVDIS